MSKFEEGQIVRDVHSNEAHMVASVHTFGGTNWYRTNTLNLHSEEGIYREEELKEVDNDQKTL